MTTRSPFNWFFDLALWLLAGSLSVIWVLRGNGREVAIPFVALVLAVLTLKLRLDRLEDRLDALANPRTLN
jgi:hypothetical protein